MPFDAFGQLVEPIPPKPFKLRKVTKTICVCDTETDPFGLDAHGDPIRVKPFSVGFYDGATYLDFWGDDCIDQFFTYLQEERADDELVIMVHNGGRFDFMFFMEYLNPGQDPFMIDDRIVKAYFGGQEFRDSYRIMPFPLAEFKKTKIDYAKFTRDRREANKREIRAYQKDDCIDLYKLVKAFFDRFGDRLTIAGTGLPILLSNHGVQMMSERQDEHFRQFYFGGRVQAFRGGIIRRAGRVVDVNSMYPFVMAHKRHPVGNQPWLDNQIGPNTHMVCLFAKNHGALCRRAEDQSLTFDVPEGEFFCTIHEYDMGLRTGTLEPWQVKFTWNWYDEHTTTFDRFVLPIYDERAEAKRLGKLGDEDALITAIFNKYLLNSPYGKLAQDPRDYEDYTINFGDIPEGGLRDLENPEGWYAKAENEGGAFIWARTSKKRFLGFKNVAAAASITGAARAQLLQGISQARGVMYCDTDSLICEDFRGTIHPTNLGAWDCEAEFDMAAIGGKKLYALFSCTPPTKAPDGDDDGVIHDPELGRLYCIKKASKGARLTASEIYRIAKGEAVTYTNPVPAFQLDGSMKTTRRTIRRTGR